MVDDIYEEFFKDHQTQKALKSSEVWQDYFAKEIERDKMREKIAIEKKLDEENSVFDELEMFRQKLNSNAQLKEKFKQVIATIELYPELKEKVNINFLNGLELLDLKD